jgi:signal transduction histidine kinase
MLSIRWESTGRSPSTLAPSRPGTSVRIVDDGPGIPAENMKRIFDPFFTTKPIGQGTGLGLDIARRIVRRHDGDIDVDSRPGGGRTEFRVTLPAL